MSSVGRGILLVFGVMVVGVMAYLFLSNSMADIPFIDSLATSMNTTPHEMGLFVGILIIAMPFIVLPLIVVFVIWGRD